MRFELNSLKGVDRQLIAAVAVLVLAIGGLVGLWWHMGTLQAAVDEQRRDLEQAELEAAGIELPTEQEMGEWTTQENLLVSQLLADEGVPLFFEDVTRLATLNQLERFGLTTEERTLEGTDDATVPADLLQAIGVDSYLVVTLTFSGRYRDTAGFIHAVGRLPRLAEFTSIELRRGNPFIDVTMEFRVYKRGTPA